MTNQYSKKNYLSLLSKLNFISTGQETHILSILKCHHFIYQFLRCLKKLNKFIEFLTKIRLNIRNQWISKNRLKKEIIQCAKMKLWKYYRRKLIIWTMKNFMEMLFCIWQGWGQDKILRSIHGSKILRNKFYSEKL